MRSGLATALATVAGVLVAAAPAAAGGRLPELEFRGQAIVPTGTMFEGTTVGGLSSITYDSRRGAFYAVSDDQGQLQPARFYTVGVDIRDGRLADGDVRFTDVTTLLAPDGLPYAPFSLDPEGLALTKDRQLVFTSEGLPNTLIDPFVRRYALDGSFLNSLPVPQPFLASADRMSGVRPNLGFESAGAARHSRYAFTATENALYQDGPTATVANNGSPARILRYDLRKGRLDRQWVYETDPVAEPPVPATQFSVNGVVELLPLDDDSLIAMERSFSVGAPGTGNSIKLYEVSLRRATNVNGVDSLQDLERVRPARKRLLLNLDELGIPLDNVEGMTFGPRLKGGRRSVVLVSDNNFAAAQFTQFLLFTLDERHH
jgi:3-phytase/alkaline phosphatase D